MMFSKGTLNVSCFWSINIVLLLLLYKACPPPCKIGLKFHFFLLRICLLLNQWFNVMITFASIYTEKSWEIYSFFVYLSMHLWICMHFYFIAQCIHNFCDHKLLHSKSFGTCSAKLKRRKCSWDEILNPLGIYLFFTFELVWQS